MTDINILVSKINSYMDNEKDNIVRFLKELIAIESVIHDRGAVDDKGCLTQKDYKKEKQYAY